MAIHAAFGVPASREGMVSTICLTCARILSTDRSARICSSDIHPPVATSSRRGCLPTVSPMARCAGHAPDHSQATLQQSQQTFKQVSPCNAATYRATCAPLLVSLHDCAEFLRCHSP